MNKKEKIIETFDVSDYEILTDTGWEEITNIHKTIPFDIWYLKAGDFYLECADEHIIINDLWEQVFVQDLKVGDKIQTLDGIQIVSEIYKTTKPAEHMYDVTVNSLNHTFYSNGILSHNTTTITIYALWYVCFQSDKKITIIANKESTAQDIFARIKMAFEQLPLYLKPSVESWRKDGFKLHNDSEIRISTTSTSSSRGQSSNCVIIDEMAHCDKALMAELWKSAIPIITSSKKSQVIVISTPNGTDNKFYELCEEAKKPNSHWVLERVDWWDVPGRDEEWKKDTIEMLGGSESDFRQEFCNDFHINEKTIVDPKFLEELKTQCIDPIMIDDNGAYRIFKLPQKNKIYVVGVDVGEGIGRSSTVAQVMDITNLLDIEQVAVYASNTISPYHFGTRLMGILQDWGEPPVLVETNNYGQQVLDVLSNTHHYENIVSYQAEGNSKFYTDNRLGVFSHTNTKYRGVTNFRYWANALKIIKFYDLETVLEMGNFVKNPNLTYSKKSDKDFDDRVMSMVWGIFILDPALATRYFNIIESDEQGRPLKIESLFDCSHKISASSLFVNKTISNYKKSKEGSTFYNPILLGDQQKNIDEFSSEMANMQIWLLRMNPEVNKENQQDKKVSESYKSTFYQTTEKEEQSESFYGDSLPMLI